MKLSIVIPAYNEEKLLPACLRSVAGAQSVFNSAGWSSEVVVCDNNSTDRTAEIAAEFGSKVVFEAKNQIGRARNAGAAAAQGEWLVFVDADSEVSPELFEALAKAINSGSVAGGGSVLSTDEGGGVRMWLPLAIWNRLSRTFRWAAGSFVFCRRDIFREVGGFDLRHFAGEELDLSVRIKRVARREGLRFVILTEGSFRTSSRKVHLYSPRELLQVLLKMIFRHRRTVEDQEACFLWYDGRR